jgi:intergrase/recombinase
MAKVGRPNQDKIRINLTLDKSIYDDLRSSNVLISPLVNNLLNNHLSLISSHHSLPLITPRSLVQIQPSLLIRDTETSVRGQENPKFKTFTNSKELNLNNTKNLKNTLFSVYKTHNIKFFEWLNNKKLSKDYINGLRNTLENTLKLNFKSSNDLKDELLKVKNRKYRALALRNLFNFCEEYEILSQELIFNLKSKIKITEKSNMDYFIPTDEQVKGMLNNIREYDNLSFIFYRVLIDSGLRVTEAQHFFSLLDKSKFEIHENIVTYPLYYLRGTKSSFYVFISLETYNLIIENFKNMKKYNMEKLKTWIKRKKLISLKYTRKYNFTLLIKSNISFEVANFIQGRASQNIGFNHYLAKKEVAIKEYKKLGL